MQKMVRGDTFSFKKRLLFANKTPVQTSDVESIFITFKKETTDSSPMIFQKELKDIIIDQDGYCHIVFKPKDTENLVYGTYYFDIEVTLVNGVRKTCLEKIEITSETTTHKAGE